MTRALFALLILVTACGGAASSPKPPEPPGRVFGSYYPVPSPSTSGNLMTSNGSAWTSAAPSANSLSRTKTYINRSMVNWARYSSGTASTYYAGDFEVGVAFYLNRTATITGVRVYTHFNAASKNLQVRLSSHTACTGAGLGTNTSLATATTMGVADLTDVTVSFSSPQTVTPGSGFQCFSVSAYIDDGSYYTRFDTTGTGISRRFGVPDNGTSQSDQSDSWMGPFIALCCDVFKSGGGSGAPNAVVAYQTEFYPVEPVFS